MSNTLELFIILAPCASLIFWLMLKASRLPSTFYVYRTDDGVMKCAFAFPVVVHQDEFAAYYYRCASIRPANSYEVSYRYSPFSPHRIRILIPSDTSTLEHSWEFTVKCATEMLNSGGNPKECSSPVYSSFLKEHNAA